MPTENKTALVPIVAFRKTLLSWYDVNKRDLPFRHTSDPFCIWLSETMLQQTTVSAVVDYYTRFLKKFPTIESVAKANDEDLLTLWQGLGYYSRIRNFKTACQQVLTNFGGRIPENFLELKTLKGVGDYTAAAIASIAFNKLHAVVDGNVKRVLARLFYFTGDLSEKSSTDFFSTKANKLLDHDRPGDFNQAVMELGATVCRPKAPLCTICPVKNFCLAIKKNPEALPIKKRQSFVAIDYAALFVVDNDSILLKKPASENLIANMWELPSVYENISCSAKEWRKVFQRALRNSNLTHIGEVRHSITNKKITAHVFTHPKFKLTNHSFAFVKRNKLGSLPLSTLSRKILSKFDR